MEIGIKPRFVICVGFEQGSVSTPNEEANTAIAGDFGFKIK